MGATSGLAQLHAEASGFGRLVGWLVLGLALLLIGADLRRHPGQDLFRIARLKNQRGRVVHVAQAGGNRLFDRRIQRQHSEFTSLVQQRLAYGGAKPLPHQFGQPEGEVAVAGRRRGRPLQGGRVDLKAANADLDGHGRIGQEQSEALGCGGLGSNQLGHESTVSVPRIRVRVCSHALGSTENNSANARGTMEVF